MGIAYCFDGQGQHDTQVMKAWFENQPQANQLIDRAGSILGYDVKQILFDQDTANRTEHMPVTAFIWNHILYEFFRNRYPEKPVCVFGHSLGHYNALVCSGALDFEDGLRLVSQRAILAAEAFAYTECGMLLVRCNGADEVSALNDLCEKQCDGKKHMAISIINSIKHIILSYSGYTFSQAEKILHEYHIRPLAVQTPYHSSPMKIICSDYFQMLETVTVRSPVVPVLSNVTSRPLVRSNIKKDLIDHLIKCIDMAACMKYTLGRQVDAYVHLSHTKTIPSLLSTNCPECLCYHIENPQEEQAYAEFRNKRAEHESRDSYVKLLGRFVTIPRFSDYHPVYSDMIDDLIKQQSDGAVKTVDQQETDRLTSIYHDAAEIF